MTTSTKAINIPVSLWEELKEIAEDNCRTMPKQILAWCKEYREKNRELTAQEYCEREPQRTYLLNAMKEISEGRGKVCHSAEELFRELGI